MDFCIVYIYAQFPYADYEYFIGSVCATKGYKIEYHENDKTLRLFDNECIVAIYNNVSRYVIGVESGNPCCDIVIK